jgi:hypothetical protein
MVEISFIFNYAMIYNSSFQLIYLQLITIPPLLYTHLSLPDKLCDKPDHTTNSHFLSHRLIANLTISWLQTKEFRYLICWNMYEIYISVAITPRRFSV